MMNIKLLILLFLTAACTNQIYGYSWAIKNGTDKDLYIHLSTNFTNPIGTSKRGVLVRPGKISDSTRKSEKIPKKFTRLMIADNELMTQNLADFSLNDDHNINYTINLDTVEQPEGYYSLHYSIRSNNEEDSSDFSLPQGVTIQQEMNPEQKMEQKAKKLAIDDQRRAQRAEEARQFAEELQKEEQRKLEGKSEEELESELTHAISNVDPEKVKIILSVYNAKGITSPRLKMLEYARKLENFYTEIVPKNEKKLKLQKIIQIL